ncbi:DUF1127 domain-containing protein [Hoeflea sp. YIM 152468]|uniref:DUF1127 domain-containing protein n=1 Tax=Hoeflea sp. YIM 152468 TaxID=3031759 RepID=UPI0023DCA365|nr:DUF1127 domain-containing protein [Hoeflea sp. YIM 152468]MDF1606815.1 DUF1127 domain-containing protein [Hoeflea sp. YIM 152468]
MNAHSFTPVPTTSFRTAVLNVFHVMMQNSQKAAKALVRRQLARKLDELSDRELADIGLTREDVHFGMSMPRNADPTVELARRARLNSFS